MEYHGLSPSGRRTPAETQTPETPIARARARSSSVEESIRTPGGSRTSRIPTRVQGQPPERRQDLLNRLTELGIPLPPGRYTAIPGLRRLISEAEGGKNPWSPPG